MHTYILHTYKNTPEGIFPSFLVCLGLSVSSELCCAVYSALSGWLKLHAGQSSPFCLLQLQGCAGLYSTPQRGTANSHVYSSQCCFTMTDCLPLSHSPSSLSIFLSYPRTPLSALLSDRAFLLFPLVFWQSHVLYFFTLPFQVLLRFLS